MEGRKRGRETSCERVTLIGCLSPAPSWGPGLQPRHVPWPGIEPVTFWFAGQHPTYWATPVWAKTILSLPLYPVSFLLPFHIYTYLILFLNLLLFILFFRERRREKEEERNIGQRNIDQLPSLGTPTQGWTHTQACALTGNQTGDFLVCGTMYNQLSYTGQGYAYLTLDFWLLSTLLAQSHAWSMSKSAFLACDSASCLPVTPL